MHVLERVPAGRLPTRIARARIANPDDQDFGSHRTEVVRLFEVLLERVDELLLDVQHASANLAHGVVVIAAGELVVSRTLAQVRRINRPRRGKRLERPIHGAARKSRFRLMQLGSYLLSRAVTAESNDGGVNHRPLSRATHSGCEHQEACTTRSSRVALDSTRQPPASTTTSSSIRTPPQPGR